MGIVSTLRDRVRAALGRDRLAAEIHEELQFHEDRLTERLEAEGLAPEAARREARRRVGHRARHQDDGYDVRGGRVLEPLAQDVRYALRRLAAAPAFTVVALVTLAVGIGANTAIFSVASGVLLQPPPYPQPDRLAMVWMDNSRINLRTDWHSYPDYVEYRDQSTTFEGMAAFNSTNLTLSGEGADAERVRGAYGTANFFDVLGIKPLYGRTFTREEDLAGATNVVIVSHKFWQQRLGGRGDALGLPLTLNGTVRRIVGIMPAGFAFPMPDTDLYVPARAGGNLRESRNAIWLQVVGRLESGVTLEQAQQDLERVNRSLRERFPATAGYGVYVQGYTAHLVGRVRPAILVLLGAVGCVLLIACANVANLLLARGAARERELAVRLAIGAGRGRLVRQLLTESLVLSAIGGLAGAALGWWSLHLLLASAPADLPRLQEIAINGRVLLFTALASLGTGMAFGLVPAIQAGRTAPGAALKEGSRGSSGAGTVLRRALVVAEVALAVVLLVGAGLMIRSYFTLQAVDLGFRTDRILTTRITLQGQRYADAAASADFFHRLLDRARAYPGVEGAAAIGTIFLSDTPNSTNFSIEGHPDFLPADRVEVPVDSITPDYFSVMDVRLVRGRAFTDSDTATSPPVVIINETMAKRFWPGEDPIGRRMKYGSLASPAPWMTVVGIVADTRRTGYDAAVRPETYLPHPQGGDSDMMLVVRTARDPAAIVPALRGIVRDLDPGVPLQAVRPLDAIVEDMTAQRRLNTVLLTAFAGIATLLAAVGLYGVMAYSVQQRTRELGVRLALGASGGSVMRLVLGEALRLVGIGLAVGLAGAAVSSSALTRILYNVRPTDPSTLAAIAAMTLFVGVIACAVPALRALRVDPARALRAD